MADGSVIEKFQNDLDGFKEDCMRKGWDEDEVEERIAEAFENFPWYKYEKEEKSSWLWKIWNIFLIGAIIYLGCGAYLAQNRRLRKNIQDKIFDLQVQYQQMRIARFLSVPVTRYLRFQPLSFESCLLGNPLFQGEKSACRFCANNSVFQSISNSEAGVSEVAEMVARGEIIKLSNVSGYSDAQVGFPQIQQIFSEYGTEVDNSICSIYFCKLYSKMSDFFDLSEEDVMERQLSIGWKNCGGYGTRFYREFFTRPNFAPNTAEMHLEKYFFLLQPSKNFTFDATVGEKEGHSYIYLAQGEAVFSFYVPEICHDDCVDEPIKVHLERGQVVHFPNSGWKFFATTLGESLSIVYLSSYID